MVAKLTEELVTIDHCSIVEDLVWVMVRSLARRRNRGFSLRNKMTVDVYLPHKLDCILPFVDLITRQWSSDVLTWLFAVA